MRPLEQCRIASQEQTVREVLVAVTMPGRRTGATMLVDAEGHLAGIFTDSDLARLFERRRDQELDGPIRSVMTANPLRVTAGSMMVDAVAIMAGRKISELPVVDGDNHPVGLVDITDVVALLPQETRASDDASAANGAATAAKEGAPASWRLVSDLEEEK
jgi:arabinose-5-phosphate isomerase